MLKVKMEQELLRLAGEVREMRKIYNKVYNFIACVRCKKVFEGDYIYTPLAYCNEACKEEAMKDAAYVEFCAENRDKVEKLMK